MGGRRGWEGRWEGGGRVRPVRELPGEEAEEQREASREEGGGEGGGEEEERV